MQAVWKVPLKHYSSQIWPVTLDKLIHVAYGEMDVLSVCVH